jgi:hypothetical protein
MHIACGGGVCYLGPMAVHLGLRQYALEVLQEHCRQPTLEDWLDGLDRLPSVPLTTSAAEAVRQARESEDAALGDALGRP